MKIFWQKYHQELQAELIRAEQAGISVSKVKREVLTPSRGASSAEVRLAKSTDMAETIIIMGEIRWCASSTANIIPLMGAPVAMEKPAQAPPVMAYRLNGEVCLPIIRDAVHPTSHPSWTQGPSVPRGIPER